MPNRILREGILESAAVASVPIPAQLLYYKLLSIADDYGRYHADPRLIRARCFPLLLDSVSETDVSNWLQLLTNACNGQQLIRIYQTDKGKFFQINNFGQKPRSASKFPEPPCEQLQTLASNCEQAQANDRLYVFGDVCEFGKGDTQASSQEITTETPKISLPEIEVRSLDTPETAEFEEVVGVFLSLGVPMSIQDRVRLEATWWNLLPEERAAARTAVLAEHAEWKTRARAYVPMPLNYFRERRWGRKRAVKGRDSPMTRTERAQEKAAEEFLREKAG